MIPVDIIRYISLHLPPGKLATVCKQFSELYNDNWYKNNLEINYPRMKLWSRTTFKDLYKLSLKSGKIHRINLKSNKLTIIPHEAIKIAEISSNFFMILKFNGDLLAISSTLSYILDTEVWDISYNSYIKANKWYLVTDITKQYIVKSNNFTAHKELIVTSDSPFISVEYFDDYILAITENKIYCMFWSSLPDRNLVSLDCPNNKKMVIGENCFILNKNGYIVVYDFCENILKKLDISLCTTRFKNLYSGLGLLKNNKVVIIIPDENNDLKPNYKIFNWENISGSFLSYNKLILLINGNIYEYDSEFPSQKPRQCYRNYQNIKSIFGWCNTMYLII
jgi:hypothetical protein